MKKRVLSLLMAFVMVISLLPATTRAAETTMDIAMDKCTVIGTYDGSNVYYIEADTAVQPEVIRFTDFSASMEDGKIVSFRSACVEGTNEAPVNDAYLVGGTWDGNGRWQPAEGYAGLDLTACYGYWLTDGEDDSYYFIVKLPSAPEPTPEPARFTIRVGGLTMTEITEAPNAYSYSDYYGTTTTVTLYTVAVPVGTTEAEICTSGNVLLYNYDEAGNYLSGWYDDIYTGGTRTTVQLDSNADGITDIIQVQTPYDQSWNSTLLYAITFDDGQASGTPERPTGNATVDNLLKNISAANTEASSDWWVMDMAAYTKAFPRGSTLSAAAKQTYINKTIAALGESSITDTTYDKAILALTAIGADPAQLYPVNSNAPINAFTGLDSVEQSTSAWSAPYTLAAYNQRRGAPTEAKEHALIDALLAAQEENGSWDEWGTIDTTANVLAGLSFYRDEERVSTAVEKAVDYLVSQMKSGGVYDGGYGANANSTAMVVIGLAAVGVDPAADERFIADGRSVFDGLLSFALPDGSGFGYTDNASLNAAATEQAFRALIAAAQVMRTGEAYNIYDFSDNDVAPARATGSGSTESPAEPTGSEITVRMTIKADSGYWFNGSVTIPGEGATVYHALIKALAEAGMSQVGAESGYVRSISKDGKTLSEFDNGENSGWLYKVNGVLPDVGLTSYAIGDGDSIVWYYTNDWTLDPDAGSMADAKTPDSPSLTPVVTVRDGAASASVSSEELNAALGAAAKSGEDTVTIAPQVKDGADRLAVTLPAAAAMAAAKQGVCLVVESGKAQVSLSAEVLNALAKNSGSEWKLEIAAKQTEDIRDNLAGEALDGASIVEVTLTVGGEPVTAFGGEKLLIDIPVDKKHFRDGDACRVLILSGDGTVERTRGRCVEKDGALTVTVETAHLSTFVVARAAAMSFSDVADTAWYADAVKYAYENGLMTGVSESEFAPDGTATRAQIVTILWRLAGSPAVNYALRYADADEGAWYGEAVRWAASTGIVTGYTESSFGPNDAITREQLAAILYRYGKAQGQGFTGMWYFPLRYDDAPRISSWADEAMHWCVMKGLLNGTSGTTLSPKDTATRAQLAVILQRFCELPRDTASKSAAQTAYDGVSAYLTAAVSAPRYGSLGGEWTVLALARGGADTESAYFADYFAALEQTVREHKGVLSERKYTEHSRVILALSALEKDARDIAGYDLTLPLGDFEKTTAQGVNGAVYALLALDSRDYPMPQNAAAKTQATRQMYVDAVLAAQLTNGGWSFMGEDADPDLTAMALQSLAKYREQSGVRLAVDRTLVCLSAMQNADGGFSSWGSENAESCAQALLALNALDLDAEDSRFVKNGNSALDALLTYQTAEGGFCHERGGETNLMASEQATCALAALVRAERGESGLYQMAALTQPAA